MATIPFESLPKEYSIMDIPKDFKKTLGSQRATKVITFTEHFEVTNEDYDKLVGLGPRRLPNESDEELKLRTILTKDLSKHKSLFYDYSPNVKKQQETI